MSQRPDSKLSRRTLVEWLGKGAVLALGAPLFEACGAAAAAGKDAGPLDLLDAGSTAGADASAIEPGLDAGGLPASFPFAPGPGTAAIFANWGERTVDPQDLTSILAAWTLTVDGLVATPKVYNFLDLVRLSRQDQTTDFHCVEGWSIYDVPWNGVLLSALLDAAQPTAKATYVAFHTLRDAYNESLPIAIAREQKTLLAYGIAGSTMPLPHGFPLRVVIPRLLGYKNAKYVYRIELTDRELDGYWVQAGYSYAGEVPANRLRPGHY